MRKIKGKEKAMKTGMIRRTLTTEHVLIAVVISTLVLLAGCQDPLTKLLKDNGYTPLIPISGTDGCYVGDIYSSDGKPVAFVEHILTRPEERDALRNSLRDGYVSLPQYDASQMFSLNVNADFVGKIQGDLEANSVRQFKVKIEDPCQYIIDAITFNSIIYPKLKDKGISDVNGKYVVIALLKVNNLEYDLMDSRGAHITVKPSGGIEKVVQANLGAGWAATDNYNLSVSHPSYIGFKLAKITEIIKLTTPESTEKPFATQTTKGKGTKLPPEIGPLSEFAVTFPLYCTTTY
jgi:hypothetical protein